MQASMKQSNNNNFAVNISLTDGMHELHISMISNKFKCVICISQLH